jgi:hypothetical protein
VKPASDGPFPRQPPGRIRRTGGAGQHGRRYAIKAAIVHQPAASSDRTILRAQRQQPRWRPRWRPGKAHLAREPRPAVVTLRDWRFKRERPDRRIRAGSRSTQRGRGLIAELLFCARANSVHVLNAGLSALFSSGARFNRHYSKHGTRSATRCRPGMVTQGSMENDDETAVSGAQITVAIARSWSEQMAGESPRSVKVCAADGGRTGLA